MAKLLLLAGAETETANNQGQTPLMLATKAQDAHCVQMLMEVLADPLAMDIKDKNCFDYVDSNAGLTGLLLGEKPRGTLLKMLQNGKSSDKQSEAKQPDRL